jgi:hypothetical protein
LLKAADPKTTGASQMAMSSAQLCLGMAYADIEFSKRDLVEAYKWTNLAITYNHFDDFQQQMIAKRDAIAQEMTRDQIEEAQRRSSESFIPYGRIVDRQCNEEEEPQTPVETASRNE